jgi:hypothetical protein
MYLRTSGFLHISFTVNSLFLAYKATFLSIKHDKNDGKQEEQLGDKKSQRKM